MTSVNRYTLGYSTMNAAAASTSVNAESFNLDTILQKASARHAATEKAVEEQAAALAAAAASEREAAVEALLYTEGNIRGYAQGLEAQERRAIAKQCTKTTAHLQYAARQTFDDREVAERTELEDTEAVAFSAIWADVRTVSAAHDFSVSLLALERGENNVRVTITVAQMRELCVLRDLSDELLEDMDEPTHSVNEVAGGVSVEEVTPTSPLLVNVTSAEQHRAAVVETTKTLLVAEANVRYTISMERQRDITALSDVMESMMEDIVTTVSSAPEAPLPQDTDIHGTSNSLAPQGIDNDRAQGNTAETGVTAIPVQDEPLHTNEVAASITGDATCEPAAEPDAQCAEQSGPEANGAEHATVEATETETVQNTNCVVVDDAPTEQPRDIAEVVHATEVDNEADVREKPVEDPVETDTPVVDAADADVAGAGEEVVNEADGMTYPTAADEPVDAAHEEPVSHSNDAVHRDDEAHADAAEATSDVHINSEVNVNNEEELATQDAPEEIVSTVPESVAEEQVDVERRLDFVPPTPPAEAALVAAAPHEEESPSPHRAGSARARPPPMPLASSGQAYPRYIRPVKLCKQSPPQDAADISGMGVEPAAPAPPSVPAAQVPEWLRDDEAAGRAAVVDEWVEGSRIALEGLHCYIAYEYDWVLAGWRRVVRNDGDMFRKQAHLPGDYRSPQKELFHERLGVLGTSPLTSPTSQDGTVANLRPAPPSARPHQQRGITVYPTPPPSRTPVEPPQRAVNDSLLQSLLFHHATGRRLTEQDYERELQALQQAYIHGLHRTLDWSRGWCETENMRVPPKPSSLQERHLPKVFRHGTDPKVAPITSSRPPADKFVTPGRRLTDASLTADIHSSAAKTVLRLPVPKELLVRPATAEAAHRAIHQ